MAGARGASALYALESDSGGVALVSVEVAVTVHIELIRQEEVLRADHAIAVDVERRIRPHLFCSRRRQFLLSAVAWNFGVAAA